MNCKKDTSISQTETNVDNIALRKSALCIQSFQRYFGLHWTFGPVKVELLPDQITFYWTKKN